MRLISAGSQVRILSRPPARPAGLESGCISCLWIEKRKRTLNFTDFSQEPILIGIPTAAHESPRWFFDICIQRVVKKITCNFELSLKRLRGEGSGGQKSFSYHKQTISNPSFFRRKPERRERNQLIKLRRAHDGCLGANRRRRT